MCPVCPLFKVVAVPTAKGIIKGVLRTLVLSDPLGEFFLAGLSLHCRDSALLGIASIGDGL